MNAQNDLLVPHPGEFIREELEARSWTQRDLAFVLGTQESAVNAIISGRRGISPEMAKSFGDAFDVNPEFFMNLQHAYDLAKAPQPDRGVATRARLQEHYPVREMIKRGWLAQADSAMLEIQIARFFRVVDPSHIPHLQHSAKKTHYDKTPPAQLAWLFRARQIADSIVSVPYSKASLRASIPRLAALMTAPEEVRHVPRILSESGVKFVVVEALPGSKIDGVCFWVGKTPVIAVSTFRDRIDNFWFVLRHEIEHVLQEHGKDQECIDTELGTKESVDINAEEKIANDAAREFLVPAVEMNDFVARVQPYFGEQRIQLFAERLQIHPGIVIGQLQRRLDRWDFLIRLQPRIRQFLIASATADGWGTIYPVDL